MTTPRDFDRIAAAWLADGPIELPARVLDAAVDEIHLTRQRHAMRLPWRFPKMTAPVRLAALVAVLALLAIGALALGVGGSAPAPTVAPTTAPASAGAVAPTILTTVGVPVLDTAFASPRNGYAMKVQPGAVVTPATKAWAPGSSPPRWGDTALDQIVVGDIRFVGTDQPKPSTQTTDEWLQAYCQAGGGAGESDCANVPAAWEKIKVAGADAYISTDGIPAAPDTISPGGKLYEAIVMTPTRAWVFKMDGALDRSVFDAFLKTVELRSVNAVDTPPLTSTFTSPTYGYSVKTLPEWTTEAAPERWTGTGNGSGLDGVSMAGTDTALTGASQPLGSRSFDDFVAAFHQTIQADVPSGCDGGDPSKWPELPVGDRVGHLEMLCNAAEVLVEDGGRVYLFEWGNATFDTERHFPFAAWKELLKSITLTPETAT
jgi:hypothetical protein